MNVALGFGTESYAHLLAAFSCAYACASLPAGLAADMRDRVPLLAIACAGWACAMCMHGCATSVGVLLASRALHGVSAAFCSPVANSLIADAFSAEQRGGAYSVYVSALYAGTALAILSGGGGGRLGTPAAGVALALGWRSSACAVGGVSALAALALLVGVPEPRRQAAPAPPTAHAGLASRGVRSVRRVLGCETARLALCAVAVRMVAGLTIMSWLPPHCKARFPTEERAFASLYAAAVCGGGMLSAVLGGFASDAVGRRFATAPHARAAVPLVGSVLAAPLFVVALTRSSLNGTMAWFFLHVLCSEVWLGPTLSILAGALPPDARGTAQGLCNFAQIGGGLLQSAFAPAASRFGLANALLVTVPAAYAASAGVFAALLRSGASTALNASSRGLLPSRQLDAGIAGSAGAISGPQQKRDPFL